MITKFSLQEHFQKRSNHSHWDLRVLDPENKSFLASWAIPKKRFPAIGERLLAIKTVNHNVNYMYFSGMLQNNDIVKLLDYGRCDILKWGKNTVMATFHGHKVKGTYLFLKMEAFSKKQDNWIIIGRKNAE
jgi:hypothetical protein